MGINKFNLQVYYIPKHFSLFITIKEQRPEERKSSWKSFDISS